MFQKNYSNFIKASPIIRGSSCTYPSLSGEEARRQYLEEIKETASSTNYINLFNYNLSVQDNTKRKVPTTILNNYRDKDLFVAAQNDDVDEVSAILNGFPEKVNITDEYGWSLLMIACQANSVATVKELLKRNVDQSVRDKAGNSARSLVIKNKNLTLVNMFINNQEECSQEINNKIKKRKREYEYMCETCDNNHFKDKSKHLSSTIHNISASKGIKCGPCYKIPESNRGYQIMLKGGWDKHNGLGPDGTGQQYPLRTVQKKDRKGLGLEKVKKQKIEEVFVKSDRKRDIESDHRRDRRKEIDFRREFY